VADSHGGGLARRQGRELRRDASAKCAEPVDGRAHHPDALDAELARRRVHRVDAAGRLEQMSVALLSLTASMTQAASRREKFAPASR
jgi:hypothetical protein